jgi:hypothetical protein
MELVAGAALFAAPDSGKVEAIDLRRPLLEDKEVYGFGERFNALNQRSRVVTLFRGIVYDALLTYSRSWS